MADQVNKLIELALGVFLGVILIGAALTVYANYSTTTWDANTTAIWGVVGVIVVIVFVLILYRSGKGK